VSHGVFSAFSFSLARSLLALLSREKIGPGCHARHQPGLILNGHQPYFWSSTALTSFTRSSASAMSGEVINSII
jgi:hypothetical protein